MAVSQVAANTTIRLLHRVRAGMAMRSHDIFEDTSAIGLFSLYACLVWVRSITTFVLFIYLYWFMKEFEIYNANSTDRVTDIIPSNSDAVFSS